MDDCGLTGRGEGVRWAGIVNVTPDSFSDGGRFCGAERAAERARALVAAGAEGIDIGAESTRPGFRAVGWREELRRLEGVVEAVRAATGGRAWISVDTRKGSVARAAAEAGADCINDVGGGLCAGMRAFLREWGGRYVLMHGMGHGLAAGETRPVGVVVRWLERGVRRLERLGVARERVAVDPGIGFGTTREQDVALLEGIGEICALGQEVWVGVSRKRVTALLRREGESLDEASWRVALEAWRRGGGERGRVVVRMHAALKAPQ